MLKKIRLNLLLLEIAVGMSLIIYIYGCAIGGHIGRDDSKITLTGKVLLPDKKPAKNATVVATPAEGYNLQPMRGETNESGEFELNNISAGIEYKITASKNGYLHKQKTCTFSKNNAEIKLNLKKELDGFGPLDEKVEGPEPVIPEDN